MSKLVRNIVAFALTLAAGGGIGYTFHGAWEDQVCHAPTEDSFPTDCTYDGNLDAWVR